VANAGLFLASEKTKLAGIEAAAEVNVQADWNESTIDADAFIKNKPTVPTNNNQLFNGEGFTTIGAVAAAYATITNLGLTTTTADNALPKVGGVDKNSLVITTGASAVSSLSGASGTIPYFEGTTPAPGLKTFAQILTNENYNISPGATYAASPVLSHLTGNPLATVASEARVAVNNYTLPANTLAANKKVRITYLGRIFQNTGADATITLYFYLGGTAILNSSAVFGSNATKRGFSIEVNVSRLATDVQLVTQEFKSAAATGGTTGAGTIGTTERSGFSSNGAAGDESGTLVASLQVQFSAVGAEGDEAAFELNDVLVEVI
jgi:hypothetical protein